MRTRRSLAALDGLALALLPLACGACSGTSTQGAGSIAVIVESEDVIVSGLEPGDGDAQVHDGWAVDFSEYLVVLGDIDLHRSTDPDRNAGAPERFIVDLTRIPTSGVELWSVDGLEPGRWDFGYETPSATSAAKRHGSATVEDFEAMVDAGATYLVRGTVSQAGGRSCPPSELAVVPASLAPTGENQAGHACYDRPRLDFEILARVPTRYGPCEIDGLAGVAIAADAVQTVAVTIHGDHLFFNGFPEGAEGGIQRLAQWLADSDLDLDGLVTREEFETIELSRLVEIDERYQLGGSPVTPLETVWDYVLAQLKTQGHFQGEGECPIDGTAHAHDHE